MADPETGALEEVVDYIYQLHRPAGYDRKRLVELKKWLHEHGYQCEKNYLDPGTNYDWYSFVYVNHKFVEENRDSLKRGFADSFERIDLDCRINQFVEDNFDEIDTSGDYQQLVKSFSSIIRRVPARTALEYYDSQSRLREGSDLADFFGGKKTIMLVEYFLDAFVEINVDRPINTDTRCHLLAGNGFTMSIVTNGQSYSNQAILDRAFAVTTADLRMQETDMKTDFADLVGKINNVIRRQDESKLGNLLKNGGWFYFKGLDKDLDVKFIDKANNIILRKCQKKVNSRGFKEKGAAQFELKLTDFSFEELLYLFEAFETSLNDDMDTMLLCKACRKVKEYKRILALAVFNNGNAVRKDHIAQDRKKDSYLSRIGILTCFTVNYDTFSDDFLTCPVVHLHGSFDRALEDEQGAEDKHEVNGSQPLSLANRHPDFHLVLGIAKEEIDLFSSELDQLKSIEGTLLVYGFSGDYDEHISSRISENSRIDKIVYFKHKLREDLESGLERSVKLDVFWKFSRMKKTIVIVDSERMFE